MGPSELVLAPAALGLLAWLLYWTFGTSKPGPNRTGAGDGLLTEVSVLPHREAADVLRARLREHGVRATVSGSPLTGFRLLVFPADEATARVLLSPNALG